ncbi:MAG: glycosyltransferase family 2 protein [Solirubrobacteraceae bacterium]
MTVAIPVLEGMATLGAVLDAVAAQDVDAEVEVLITDSGSHDGSAQAAAERGATVVPIRREDFSHGGTRNLLVQRAAGSHVAFLTQDAVPAGPGWLAELLRGFDLAPDVGLTFGPYVPRPDASPWVARELETWFASMAPDGAPRVERLAAGERDLSPLALLGPRAFFTDANGCIDKAAWARVPFRAVPYAEDHQLALDMLYAGYAKAYMPRAAVVHSHEYGVREQLRRSFDEWRALREVYGYVEPLGLRRLRATVVGPMRVDGRRLRGQGANVPRLVSGVAGGALYHAARYAGSVLGTRADRLPPPMRRRLSLERRSTFADVHPSSPQR